MQRIGMSQCREMKGRLRDIIGRVCSIGLSSGSKVIETVIVPSPLPFPHLAPTGLLYRISYNRVQQRIALLSLFAALTSNTTEEMRMVINQNNELYNRS
jgi:hypothetical protein